MEWILWMVVVIAGKMNKKDLDKLPSFDKPPKEWAKYKNYYMNEIRSKLTKAFKKELDKYSEK